MCGEAPEDTVALCIGSMYGILNSTIIFQRLYIKEGALAIHTPLRHPYGKTAIFRTIIPSRVPSADAYANGIAELRSTSQSDSKAE